MALDIWCKELAKFWLRTAEMTTDFTRFDSV
jgi:hypothetical protein